MIKMVGLEWGEGRRNDDCCRQGEESRREALRGARRFIGEALADVGVRQKRRVMAPGVE